MKKLTAGIFTVLMGLVSVNAADAAVASKGYVDNKFFTIDAQTQHVAAQKTTDDAQDAKINKNTADIATNAGAIATNAEKIGDATFTDANYVSSAKDLTAAVAALDDAVKNVAGGNLQLGKDAVDSNIIKDGEVKTDDIANSAVTDVKIADKAVTANKLSDDLSATISGKADKATTLSGYGITDVYTKTEADAKFIDTTEIEGYATDAELDAVSDVANAADALSKTNQGAINVLNGDVNTDGSVAKKINDATTQITTAYTTADTATLNSAKTYTNDEIAKITSTDNGILKQANTYTDTEVKKLADGAVATNAGVIAKLDGDVTVEGSVKKLIQDATTTVTNAYTTADTATLNSANAYTDEQIEALDLQAISRVPAECGNKNNYCVLTTNGTNFVWEVIVREDTTLDQGDDGLYGEYPATE